MRGKDVESYRKRFIGRIKEDHIADTLRRNTREDVIDEISVRIEDCEAVPGFDVLDGHREEERTLARARRADHVGVAEAPRDGERDHSPLAIALLDAQHEVLPARPNRRSL